MRLLADVGLGGTNVACAQTYKGRDILPTEGRSLVPILDGKQRQPHPNLFWEHVGHRAIRQGNLKLVSLLPKNSASSV